MSEYIEIETETGDDPAVLYVYTNVPLTAQGEAEEYESPAAMEEGSPVAQAFSYVEGIRRLQLQGEEMIVWRDLEVPWHLIVADLSAAVRDFFL